MFVNEVFSNYVMKTKKNQAGRFEKKYCTKWGVTSLFSFSRLKRYTS